MTHPWTPSGLELLSNLNNLARSSGGNLQLAYHIIVENPEYYRAWNIRNQAQRQITAKYTRTRYRSVGRVNSKIWTEYELKVIEDTLHMTYKEIAHLLPNRTQGAVWHRRFIVRHGKENNTGDK